jgi:ribosomal-protein-alanine N-acetyltransferase
MLTLRPPTPSDAAALLAFELENRAYFESWINARAPSYYSQEGVALAIAQAMLDRQRDAAYQYLMLDQGEIVGRINLNSVLRPHYRRAELGYRVGERHAGRGYATQAVRLVLEQAFGTLDLWRLHATVRPENTGSLRVLERSGFQVYGRSRCCFELHGQWYDLLQLELHSPQAASSLAMNTLQGSSG